MIYLTKKIMITIYLTVIIFQSIAAHGSCRFDSLAGEYYSSEARNRLTVDTSHCERNIKIYEVHPSRVVAQLLTGFLHGAQNGCVQEDQFTKICVEQNGRYLSSEYLRYLPNGTDGVYVVLNGDQLILRKGGPSGYTTIFQKVR